MAGSLDKLGLPLLGSFIHKGRLRDPASKVEAPSGHPNSGSLSRSRLK